MIKANAYGHGAIQIAKKIEVEKLADYFGVASTSEGIELRKAGVVLPIMIQNPNFSDWEIIMEHHLEPVIHNFDGLQSLEHFLSKKKLNLNKSPIHIKLNTGMNRFGFIESETEQLNAILSDSKFFQVQSIMSHLSSSGNNNEHDFTITQLEQFKSMLEQLNSTCDSSTLTHILNTDGIISYSNYQMSMIRIGIGIYGASDNETLKNSLHTTSVFRSKVVEIRTLKKGESISYNRSGKINELTNIAVLSLGYADGLPRKLGNGNWEMEINGKLYPTIGAICMDLCMINLRNDTVKLGDEAIVFGGLKSIFDYSKALDTISYEAFTLFGNRVKRVIV